MSEPPLGPCPFKPGDVVYYRPTPRGRGLGVMQNDIPKIGEPVRISTIEKGLYIVWEGCTSPGSGIFWTEFSTT
jgi:hypothetical protein